MRLCLILPSRGLVGEDSLGHIYCCRYLLMIVGCVLSFFLLFIIYFDCSAFDDMVGGVGWENAHDGEKYADLYVLD